jgi:hypothetical protein
VGIVEAAAAAVDAAEADAAVANAADPPLVVDDCLDFLELAAPLLLLLLLDFGGIVRLHIATTEVFLAGTLSVVVVVVVNRTSADGMIGMVGGVFVRVSLS